MFLNLGALFFLSLCTIRKAHGTTTTIKIGGYFNIFEPDGTTSIDGIHSLAATLMAFDEINSEPNLLRDYTLELVVRDGLGGNGAVAAMKEFVSAGVIAVLGHGNDEETEVSNRFLVASQTLMLHSKAMNVMFGDGGMFPYKIQTTPVDSFQGMVLQNLICKLFAFNGTLRDSVFVIDNMFGTKTDTESGDLTYCIIEKVSVHLVKIFDLDDALEKEVARAKEADTRFILLAIDDISLAAKLLVKLYEGGLVRAGTQIMGPSQIASRQLLEYMVRDLGISQLEIPKIMRGFVAIEYIPNYSLVTAEGQSFVSKFRSLPSTKGSGGSCVNTKDYSNTFFLYRNADGSKCAGEDFQGLHATGNTIAPYAPHAYDAAWSMAYALEIISANGKSLTTIKGPDLMTALLNVSFTGASGFICYFEGMEHHGYYGQGNREEGHHFRIKNFNELAYLKNNSEGLVTTGIWSLENFINWNDTVWTEWSGETVYKVTYNSLDNEPPNGMAPYEEVTLPTVLKLGALFPIFGPDGTPNISHVHCLAAFIMAVEDVNDSPDILPNTSIKIAFRSASSFSGIISATDQLLHRVFGLSTEPGDVHVHGIIGGSENIETMASNMMLNDFKTIQVHTRAQDVDFGEGSKYKYKVQICPIESYQGMVLQHIMCEEFGYLNVVVFASDDSFGSRMAIESGDRTFCLINKNYQVFVRSSNDDDTLNSYVMAAKDTGAKVILLLMKDTKLAARILEMGYQAKLFEVGTQIFAPGELATSALWSEMDPALVPIILKGFITIQYIPNYSLLTDIGKEFVRRYRSRNPTLGSDGTCDMTMDDSQSAFLYRSPSTNGQNVSCGGMNFSEVSVDGFDLDPYTSHTYDAVWAFAHSVDYIIKNSLSLDSDTIRDVIEHVTNFTGVTGYVKFFEGMANYGYYGRGAREVGHHYRVLNFHPELYAANNLTGFVLAGVWSIEDGIVWNDPVFSVKEPMFEPVYNTKDGMPALDHDPDTLHTVNGAIRGFIFALASLALATNIFFFFVVFKFRNSKLMKASQPGMLYLILAGGILTAGRVINGALDITDGTCISGLWLGHMGFNLGFGSLFVKTWRVDRIVNNKSLKRVTILEQDVLRIVGWIVLFFSVYLVILTAVGQPHKFELREFARNHFDIRLKCSFVQPIIHTVLFVLEAVLVVYGMNLCWATKDVPDAINESKLIAAAMTFVTMLSILVFPIIFLLGLYPEINIIIASLAFAVGDIFAISVLFGPKAMILLYGGDIGKDMKVVYSADAKKGRIVPTETETNAGNSSGKGSSADALFANAKVAFKGMTKDHRSVLCREQIELWRTLLLQNDQSTSSTGSNRGSSSMNDQASHFRESLHSGEKVISIYENGDDENDDNHQQDDRNGVTQEPV